MNMLVIDSDRSPAKGSGRVALTPFRLVLLGGVCLLLLLVGCPTLPSGPVGVLPCVSDTDCAKASLRCVDGVCVSGGALPTEGIQTGIEDPLGEAIVVIPTELSPQEFNDEPNQSDAGPVDIKPPTCIDDDNDGFCKDFPDAKGRIDCDDTNKDIHPDAKELCDGIDNNCDGLVDETFKIGEACLDECKQLGLYACKKGDVNARVCVIAGQTNNELCNDKDDDCDGKIDEDFPDKGSPCVVGIGGCQVTGKLTCQGNGLTCDATPKAPAASETCGDGIDNNCNGQVDEGCVCNSGEKRDCGIDKGECRKGKQECINGKWQTACVGEVKATKDICDGKDNDCDGRIDEDFPLKGQLCTDGKGECQESDTYTCAPDGTLKCNAAASPPSKEICDGKDNDCDGVIDNGFPDKGNDCTITASVSDSNSCSSQGKTICKADGTGTKCSAQPPVVKVWYQDSDGDGYGDPNNSKKDCVQPQGYVSNNRDCYDKNKEAFPGQTKYFTSNRGDGSYDYNCDGSTSYQYTQRAQCGSGCRGGRDGYSSRSGRPNCGSGFYYYTSCYSYKKSCYLGGSSYRRQGCR